jgi:hypothetical protein
VYDVAGRLVARLLEEEARPAGVHTVTWTPRAAAGAYFYRLSTPHGSAARRMLRMR